MADYVLNWTRFEKPLRQDSRDELCSAINDWFDRLDTDAGLVRDAGAMLFTYCLLVGDIDRKTPLDVLRGLIPSLRAKWESERAGLQ